MRSLLILLVLVATPTLAEIYRWTDAEGRIHFGQRPPAQAERIEVRPQVIERDQQTREREARSERFFQARRDEQAQQQQRSAEQDAERQQHITTEMDPFPQSTGNPPHHHRTQPP